MQAASRKARNRPRSGATPVEEPPAQEVGEELLGQVLGLLGRRPAAADEGVERVPVGLAERGQGLAGPGLGRVPGGQDQAPAGGGELPGLGAGSGSGMGASPPIGATRPADVPRPAGSSVGGRGDVETGAGGGGRLAGPSIATPGDARGKFLPARDAALAPIGGTEQSSKAAGPGRPIMVIMLQFEQLYQLCGLDRLPRPAPETRYLSIATDGDLRSGSSGLRLAPAPGPPGSIVGRAGGRMCGPPPLREGRSAPANIGPSKPANPASPSGTPRFVNQRIDEPATAPPGRPPPLTRRHGGDSRP